MRVAPAWEQAGVFTLLFPTHPPLFGLWIMRKNDLFSNRSIICLFFGLMACAVLFVFLCRLEDGRVVRAAGPAEVLTPVECSVGKVEVAEYVRFTGGYITLEKEPVQTWDLRVALAPVGGGEVLVLPTYMLLTDSLKNELKSDDPRYSRIGFTASCRTDKLALSTHEYKVYVYYNSNERDCYVDTGATLTAEGLVLQK